MTTKQFKAHLKDAGCTAEIQEIGRDGYDIVIDAPDGKVFRGTGTHCLVHNSYTASQKGERARVRAEAIADMHAQLPLEDCREPECDVCGQKEGK